MFGLGFGEILIVLVVALVLLGPQRLPDVAKQLGKGLREFRKATEDLKSQFEDEFYAEPKPAARPSLVPPTPARTQPTPVAPAPPATAENVPGLEAARVETAAPPTPPMAALGADPAKTTSSEPAPAPAPPVPEPPKPA